MTRSIFRNDWWLLLIAMIGLVACRETPEQIAQRERGKLVTRITMLEDSIQAADHTKEVNRKLSQQLVLCYKQYSEKFGEDSIQTPEYLFNAARVVMGDNEFQHAVQLLQQIETNYPTYERLPDCMYLIGFIYDYHLKYKDIAKEAYEKLIQKYPQHHFAKEAKIAIENLMLTDEEILEKFSAQNTTE